jgi:type IV pilus assembly protein PilW
MNERGVSIVELMIGTAITLAVVSAGHQLVAGTEKATNVSDQTARMQQNARIAMELIAHDIKLAGFGMNGPVGTCNTAIVPNDQTKNDVDKGPDSVSLVAPTEVGTLASQANGSAASISLTAGSVASVSGDGFGDGAPISINGAAPSTVNTVAGDTLTLSAPLGPSVTFPAGAKVYWLRCITYSIGTTTNACAGAAPCLLRGGTAIAEGIEDLQLAYACDGCRVTPADGVIDDQGVANLNLFDTNDFVSNSTWDVTPMTPDTIRLVRVSLVARQAQNDIQWSGTAPTQVEDHNPADDQGYVQAQYAQSRRRILSRTVQVRNVGLSG